MMSRLRRWLCGLRGHTDVLHVELGLMTLRCTSCGYETHGWWVPGPHSADGGTFETPVEQTPRVVRFRRRAAEQQRIAAQRRVH